MPLARAAQAESIFVRNCIDEDHKNNVIFHFSQNNHGYFAHSESMHCCLSLLCCASSSKAMSAHGLSPAARQDTGVIMPASVRGA